MRQAPHLPNLGALPAVLIWGVAGLVTMAQSSHAMATNPNPNWLIHEWMEEKDPNLPKEFCSLSFVLWVSFPLLSFYLVLRESYRAAPRRTALSLLSTTKLLYLSAACVFFSGTHFRPSDLWDSDDK